MLQKRPAVLADSYLRALIVSAFDAFSLKEASFRSRRSRYPSELQKHLKTMEIVEEKKKREHRSNTALNRENRSKIKLKAQSSPAKSHIMPIHDTGIIPMHEEVDALADELLDVLRGP